MAIFNGKYECKLDAKGRLVLPAKIKAALPESPGNELILRRGLEPCLVLYTMQEAMKRYAMLEEIDETDEEGMAFKRAYFRGEVPVELDSAGRFLIPRSMLEYADIDKIAIIAGVGKRIEVWNPDIYEEYHIKDHQKYVEMNRKYFSKKNE